MNQLATVDPDSTTIAASLAKHAADARGAYAPNTERALRSDVLVFSTWCADTGRPHLPATPDTVAGFIDAMGETKAPATIRRYVSSVATFHRAAGATNPVDTLTVKLALKRLHRAKGRAQAQAAPLTRQLVDRMLAATSGTPIGLRNRALLATAYDTLARRSELASLQTADMQVAADGVGTIVIRRSKTDQDGMGMVRYLAPDTLRHLTAWCAVASIDGGLLFRSVGKGGHTGGELDGGEVSRIFKGMAKAAGLALDDVARISGHSSRVGAAQDMVRHGVELPAIMQAGGWKTAEMVGRYTARLDARRSGAARLAMLQDRA